MVGIGFGTVRSVACHIGAIEDLFASANRCLELRAELGLDVAGSAADNILIACREAASGDAQHRGPRKRAEWLLQRLLCDLTHPSLFAKS
jgi:hypothetical protein